MKPAPSHIPGLPRIGLPTLLQAGVLLLAGIIQATTSQAAPNIFDDDWVPPKRDVPTRPTEPTPPSRPAETTPTPTVPQTPEKPAVRSPVPNVPPAKFVRHTVPPASDLARSRSQLKDLFAAQMADRTITGRRTLAKTLLDEVPRTADNPVDQYALLGGAINAAKEGADVRLCFKAADLLASTFEVDGLATKIKATLTMPLRADSAANTAENARTALGLIDTLIAAEDFISATKLCALLKPLASTDPSISDLILRRSKEVETLRAQRDRVAPHLEKLKTLPDDPAANLVVGTYYCFARGAWKQGLPMLAKGSDAELKKLALDELSESKTDADASRLGDAWWKVGERQSESIRMKTWQHAAAYYRRALDSSTGLRRALLEKRIREAPLSDEPGHVNLLALFDPAKDTLNGVAKVENGVLSAASSKNLRIEFPYAPPPEYDYSVVLRASGFGEFLQILTADGRQFSWRTGAFDGKWSYFEVLDGGTYGRFGDKFAKDKWMTAGERYAWTIKVRRDGVEAFLNDKLVTKHKTDYHDVSLLPGLKLSRADILGLQCAPEVEIESVTVLEITGQGHVLRDK